MRRSGSSDGRIATAGSFHPRSRAVGAKRRWCPLLLWIVGCFLVVFWEVKHLTRGNVFSTFGAAVFEGLHPDTNEKYLIGSVLGGDLTNQMWNMWTVLMMSRFLNRTLVLSPMAHYAVEPEPGAKIAVKRWHRPTDYFTADSIMRCGIKVMHMDEFVRQHGHPYIGATVDTLGCIAPQSWLQADPHGCTPEDMLLYDAHPLMVRDRAAMSYEQFVSAELADQPVIGTGAYMFFMADKFMHAADFALPEGCLFMNFEPHPKYLEAGIDYADTVLGGKFLAAHVHMCKEFDERWLEYQERIGGNASRMDFYGSLIQEQIIDFDLPIVYVTSNGNASEMAAMADFLARDGYTMFSMRDLTSALPPSIDVSDPHQLVMVDKIICSHATAFIAMPSYPYSDNIIQIRNHYGRAKAHDRKFSYKLQTL